VRWKILQSKILLTAGIFRLRSDTCELPDGRVMPNYYVFEFPDWVNVVPLTANGEVVLVKQHRHGAEQDFLEIPGGSTDRGGQEEPLLAAERELREETGYTSAEWIYCGSHYPNPSLQGNRMHTFVALGCRKTAEMELDPFEDLHVVHMALPEVTELWRNGGFSHSLISASLGLSFKTLAARGFKVWP
jgi:ADP-ribose pyrophosphatase